MKYIHVYSVKKKRMDTPFYLLFADEIRHSIPVIMYRQCHVMDSEMVFGELMKAYALALLL